MKSWHVWKTLEGKLFLRKCPNQECGLENWAPTVASGQCAWCGYMAQDTDINDTSGNYVARSGKK